MLYKRLPASAKEGPSVSALYKLLQVLWNKQYQVTNLT